MYFVRSGVTHLLHATLDLAGTNSYTWSSTAYPSSTQHTFSFHFDATAIVPSNLNSRWLGHSLHNLIPISLMSLFCISSVVAICTFHMVQSGSLAPIAISGPPSHTQPASNTPLIYIFTPLTPIHQITITAPTVFPFAAHLYSFSMYFVRSGWIDPIRASLMGGSGSNYTWGSTAQPANINFAFHSIFSSTNIQPSDSNSRFFGFSLQSHFHHSFMYFVRSGIINLQYGSIRFADSHGLFWSSTSGPANPSSAFDLAVYPKSTLYPSDNTSRAYAYSLRLISPN